MGFNESGEYKETFIGFGVGIGLVQVLQGDEFEVEPLGDHTFEVEPQGNVLQVAGSQRVETQNFIGYHFARNREHHSTWELFRYRENSKKTTFEVTEAEKIYAHESLTFNDTVACEAEIWVTNVLLNKSKGNILGMKVVKDRSGNALRVSQSKVYNEKLVQTLLEGHSILLLEGSLSGNCDVENNGKWSYAYTVRSHEYHGVCMTPNIASSDVGMLDGFDRGL
ncbi:hypothetical protein Tco_0493472 [Tanacetum coccineum]